MGNVGSLAANVDEGLSCVPLNINTPFSVPFPLICLEAFRMEKGMGAGGGGGKICARLTIPDLGTFAGEEIVPFGANGRTKVDFENLDTEEVIAEQCVSDSQLDVAVVANPGLGFFLRSNLVYADKVAFLFTLRKLFLPLFWGRFHLEMSHLSTRIYS